jgi:uronate dehydrogenase
MKPYNRILITGAAGRLGSELRNGLGHLAQHIRLSDRVEATDLQQNEEMIVCELGDYDAVMALTKDVDAIVHFGGAPLETDFETIHDSNIRGSYHVYEGARKNGARRVIYASSVHAIGYHEMTAQIDADSPVRPDSLYGVSKNFVESLSRLYWDKFGIESLCLRIFSSFPEPADRRMLWNWLSFADCVQYVERGLIAPYVGHTIGHGLSDNRLRPVDDSKAGHIGFSPKDTADGYRGAVEERTEPADP